MSLISDSVEGTALIMAASIPLTRPILHIIGQGFLNLPASISSLGIFSGGNSRTGGSGTEGDLGDNSGATSGRANSANPFSRSRRPSASKASTKDDILLLETETNAFRSESDDGHVNPDYQSDGIYQTRAFQVRSDQMPEGTAKKGQWQSLP